MRENLTRWSSAAGRTAWPPPSRWPRPGLRVHVIEGAPTIGGGCRTEELTLPGFRHDVCSAAHPLAVASPFFQRFDLAARGVTLALARGGVRPSAGRRPGRRA